MDNGRLKRYKEALDKLTDYLGGAPVLGTHLLLDRDEIDEFVPNGLRHCDTILAWWDLGRVYFGGTEPYSGKYIIKRAVATLPKLELLVRKYKKATAQKVTEKMKENQEKRLQEIVEDVVMGIAFSHRTEGLELKGFVTQEEFQSALEQLRRELME